MKRLLKYTEILKHLERTGWKRKDISSPETVASHSYQMAMMALFLSTTDNKEYDFDKVLKLCLIHDLAESKIGDIIPNDVAYKNKKQKEKEAMLSISQELNMPILYELFLEYDENKTKEANLANDLDQIDMYVQSKAYEAKYPNKDLEEFRLSAITKIRTKLGLSILNHIG